MFTNTFFSTDIRNNILSHKPLSKHFLDQCQCSVKRVHTYFVFLKSCERKVKIKINKMNFKEEFIETHMPFIEKMLGILKGSIYELKWTKMYNTVRSEK